MRSARAVIKSFGLPSLLLLIVAVTHMGYDPIATLYPDENQLAAAKAWQHVLRAFPEATLLWLTVWLLIPWNPIAVRLGGSIVCCWGALESFKIAACRLQFPMDRKPPATPLFGGLCDTATGWPIYTMTAGAVFAVTLLVWLKRKKS